MGYSDWLKQELPMRKVLLLLATMLVASLVLAQSDQSTPAPAPAPQAQDQQPPADQSKDKKKDKKKKDKDDPASTEEFSDRVVTNIMREIQDGLEGHVQRILTSTFDDNQMDGYLQLEDQIEQFFNKYDAIRIHYRIIQNSVEGPKGIALVELQMEAAPRDGRGPSLRRDEQFRFELERGKKGWKIVDFQPRNFFNP
jgi:hypothetical protein